MFCYKIKLPNATTVFCTEDMNKGFDVETKASQDRCRMIPKFGLLLLIIRVRKVLKCLLVIIGRKII
jgi:hypothetical protein